MSKKPIGALAALFLCWALPNSGFAQNEGPDLAGYWRALPHVDFRVRTAGPAPGEIGGLPLNDNGVEAALSFDPNDYYKPENQCRNHGAGYVMRGPTAMHYVYEDDDTLLIRIQLEALTRRIYLDGRLPPSEEHTSLGHSVGRWENGILTVTTTHLTPYYHRRNGVPYSEDAVMTEHFVLHDDEYLSLITKVDDPEYLSEPIVRSVSFRKLPDAFADRFSFVPWECEIVEWEGGAPGRE